MTNGKPKIVTCRSKPSTRSTRRRSIPSSALPRKPPDHDLRPPAKLRHLDGRYPHIRAQFSTSHQTYGAPRMHVELKEYGLQVGRHSPAQRKWPESPAKSAVTRRHRIAAMAARWPPISSTRISVATVSTAEGWLYLAIVPDLYLRRIVSLATSDRLKKDLALNALRCAIQFAARYPA